MPFTARDTLAAPPEQSDDQRRDEQNQENEEENLRDFRGARGYSAEAKDCCDDRYDKKYQCVVEHFVILSARSRAHIE